MELNKDLISKLKFISKIQKGEKINVRYMYLQQDCLLTQISRTFISRDSRANTMAFVQETVYKVFELLESYNPSQKSSEKIMCCNLIKDLKKSKDGMNNLKDTYISDVKFLCDMDTLIEVIDAKTQVLEQCIKVDNED